MSNVVDRHHPDVHSDHPDMVLEVRDLVVDFLGRKHASPAVRSLSYSVARGQTLAMLGESGSGKSVSALAVMGLLSPRDARVSGSVLVGGVDMVAATPAERRRLRGESIAMIFQDALIALNPVYTVGQQIAEMFTAHRGGSRRDARREAIQLLDMVGIPNAASRFHDYPHEFSGGMRQRVMIAMAIALRPQVLIADEPTTALDVTVQAQILELLKQIQRDTGTGMVLITHDIGVAAQYAHQVCVMYGGRAIETGSVSDVLGHPRHPYTEALLKSMPRRGAQVERLNTIGGSPPNLAQLPPGCAFHPRCQYARKVCAERIPDADVISEGRTTRCLLHKELFP